MTAEQLRVFLANRNDFYTVTAGRIPDARLRADWARQAARSADISPAIAPPPESGNPDAEEWLGGLALRDLLKKPREGRVLGRTVISMEEMIDCAIMIETTGILLFEAVAECTPDQAAICREAARDCRRQAAELERLRDDFRYHRRFLGG